MRNIKSLIRPTFGSFALDKSTLDWVTCRERFAVYFTALLEGFYFSHEQDRICFTSFINKTEEILQIDKTKFDSTNIDYITWVVPSKWWKEYSLRRSLFTLLLRAGQCYLPLFNNYEDALFSNKCLSETKNAVMRFLYGINSFKEETKHGWHATFINKDLNIIKRAMISKTPDRSPVVAGTLWS